MEFWQCNPRNPMEEILHHLFISLFTVVQDVFHQQYENKAWPNMFFHFPSHHWHLLFATNLKDTPANWLAWGQQGIQINASNSLQAVSKTSTILSSAGNIKAPKYQDRIWTHFPVRTVVNAKPEYLFSHLAHECCWSLFWGKPPTRTTWPLLIWGWYYYIYFYIFLHILVLSDFWIFWLVTCAMSASHLGSQNHP